VLEKAANWHPQRLARWKAADARVSVEQDVHARLLLPGAPARTTHHDGSGLGVLGVLLGSSGVAV
jgi:hypothetical protein